MPLVLNEVVLLDDDSAHYLRSVLRIKKDHLVILFNGVGGEYQGKVVEISRKSVQIELIFFDNKSIESPIDITLGIGISRGERMDFVVQKSVELGVNKINPLITEHCVVQLKEDKKEKKIGHWQKISQNAAEQSGRTVCPAVEPIEQLAQWAEQQKGLKVFLDPFADKTLAQLQPEIQQVTLLAGPEGGFSEQERIIAEQAGFIPIQMGARVLRTETAALASLTAIQVLWGDLGGFNA